MKFILEAIKSEYGNSFDTLLSEGEQIQFIAWFSANLEIAIDNIKKRRK